MNPSVCIILINYNTYDDTVECVKSLGEINYDNYHIIIVDNSSNDAETLKQDSQLCSTCDVIYASENRGFSSGNNIGILYAQEKYEPDYYLILNNDTVVEKNFLLKLVKCAALSPQSGIITGQIHYYKEKDKISFKGGFFDTELGKARYFGADEKSKTSISFATGCLWLLPACIISNIGLLDENFFMYSEDVDYCCRVINSGYDITYCDEAIIYHKGAASSGISSKFHQYYTTRNSLFIIHKYATKKLRAYINYFKETVRDIILGRKTLSVCMQALIAFCKRESGRNARY